MRLRTRMRVRPLLFLLLLLGIAAVRAGEGFPQHALTSLHRVVTHPGKYLEDATYGMDDDVAMKQSWKGKRWWRNSAVHSPLEGQFPSPGHADIPSRFSDSGGFLQLCLLLIFCLAVICCASVSITPWYKLDSAFFKKCLAGIWLAFALVLDILLAKLAISSDPRHESSLKYGVRQSGYDSGKLNSQPQQRPAKKAGKGKKRRATFSGTLQNSHSPSPPSRTADETISIASEEGSVSTDPELGQHNASVEPEPVPVVYMTPADAQIARLEAEAAEKQLQRLARQKKHATQVQVAKTEEARQPEVPQLVASPKPSPSPRPGNLSKASQAGKQESSHRTSSEHSEGAQNHPAPERKPGPEVYVRTYPRKQRDGHGRGQDGGGQDHLRCSEGDQRSKFPRKPFNERNQGNSGQVLLVPRRALYNKQKPIEVQSAAEELSEKQIAPHTPDRVATQSARSPLNSPQSLASPSRPYAEVAKENLPSTAWSTNLPIVPPPPPPPPRRLSALPKSAVYAQEFTPASRRLPEAPQLQFLEGSSLPQHRPQDILPVLSRTSAPPSLEIPNLAEFSEGHLDTTSPFPGMSSHRKRVGLPITGVYSNVLPNQLPSEYGGPGPFSGFTSRAPSSTESDPSPAFLARPTSPWPVEPGFPGILDRIWCTGPISRNEVISNPWTGNHELVSDVSLASSSDLGSSVFGRHDPPLLAMGLGSF